MARLLRGDLSRRFKVARYSREAAKTHPQSVHRHRVRDATRECFFADTGHRLLKKLRHGRSTICCKNFWVAGRRPGHDEFF